MDTGVVAEGAVDLGSLYRSQIRPTLEPLEAERLRLLKQRRLLEIGSVAAAAAIVAVLAAIEAGFTVWALVLIGGLMVFLIARQGIGAKFRREIRGIVMTPIARAFGVSHSVDGSRFPMSGLRDAGVVGAYNRSRFEDLIEGRHRETGYAMVEAHLRQRSSTGKSSSTRTVFRGLLLRIEVPVAFRGKTLIARDHGRIGNALHALGKSFTSLRRVETPFADFEALYEVFTDAPEEVESLIGRGFADSMIALSRAHEGKGLTGAFVDGRFLLAVPCRRDLFAAASLGRPLSAIEGEIEKIAEDMQIAHRVIDHLHGVPGERLVR